MRLFIFPRMGCLAWFFVGWVIFLAYCFVFVAILAWILALSLVGALGVAFDWTLKAIPAYRRRRATLPLSWPTALFTVANSTLTKATAGGKTGAPVVAPPGIATSSQPPPDWYRNPDDADSMRWWDGTKWTEHIQAPPA